MLPLLLLFSDLVHCKFNKRRRREEDALNIHLYMAKQLSKLGEFRPIKKKNFFIFCIPLFVVVVVVFLLLCP